MTAEIITYTTFEASTKPVTPSETTPILFEKKLDDGLQKLMVLRGINFNADLLPFAPFNVKSTSADRADGINVRRNAYSVSVEIVTPGAVSIQLAVLNRLELDSTGTNVDNFSVLDVMISENDVILAYVSDYSVVLWRALTPEGPRFTAIDGYQWNPVAAARRLDKQTVGAKLGLLDDGRRTVQMVHRGFETENYYTLLTETAKNSFEFKMTRNWTETKDGEFIKENWRN